MSIPFSTCLSTLGVSNLPMGNSLLIDEGVLIYPCGLSSLVVYSADKKIERIISLPGYLSCFSYNVEKAYLAASIYDVSLGVSQTLLISDPLNSKKRRSLTDNSLAIPIDSSSFSSDGSLFIAFSIDKEEDCDNSGSSLFISLWGLNKSSSSSSLLPLPATCSISYSLSTTTSDILQACLLASNHIKRDRDRRAMTTLKLHVSYSSFLQSSGTAAAFVLVLNSPLSGKTYLTSWRITSDLSSIKPIANSFSHFGSPYPFCSATWTQPVNETSSTNNRLLVGFVNGDIYICSLGISGNVVSIDLAISCGQPISCINERGGVVLVGMCMGIIRRYERVKSNSVIGASSSASLPFSYSIVAGGEIKITSMSLCPDCEDANSDKNEKRTTCCPCSSILSICPLYSEIRQSPQQQFISDSSSLSTKVNDDIRGKIPVHSEDNNRSNINGSNSPSSSFVSASPLVVLLSNNQLMRVDAASDLHASNSSLVTTTANSNKQSASYVVSFAVCPFPSGEVVCMSSSERRDTVAIAWYTGGFSASSKRYESPRSGLGIFALTPPVNEDERSFIICESIKQFVSENDDSVPCSISLHPSGLLLAVTFRSSSSSSLSSSSTINQERLEVFVVLSDQLRSLVVHKLKFPGECKFDHKGCFLAVSCPDAINIFSVSLSGIIPLTTIITPISSKPTLFLFSSSSSATITLYPTSLVSDPLSINLLSPSLLPSNNFFSKLTKSKKEDPGNFIFEFEEVILLILSPKGNVTLIGTDDDPSHSGRIIGNIRLMHPEEVDEKEILSACSCLRMLIVGYRDGSIGYVEFNTIKAAINNNITSDDDVSPHAMAVADVFPNGNVTINLLNQRHLTGVSSLCASSDGRYLYSGALDGSVMCLSYTSDSLTTTVATPYMTEEVLIENSSIRDKISEIEELQRRLVSMKIEFDRQLLEKELLNSKHAQSKKEECKEKVIKGQAKFDQIQTEKNEIVTKHRDERDSLTSRHAEYVEQLEKSFQHKMTMEKGRYSILVDDVQQEKVDWEELVDSLDKEKSRSLEAVQFDSDNKQKAFRDQRQVILEAKENALKVHQEFLREIEIKNDQQIDDIKDSYEKRLLVEKDEKVRLRGQAGIHRKHHEDLKRQMTKKEEELKSWQEQCKKKLERIDNLIKDKEANLKELKEREKTIIEKERTIAELRRQNQELDKFKFILDYKVRELKGQIDPKNEDIKKIKVQISQIDVELEEYSSKNRLLDFEIERLLLKQRVAIQDISHNKKKLLIETDMSDRIAEDLKSIKKITNSTSSSAPGNSNEGVPSTSEDKKIDQHYDKLKKIKKHLVFLYKKYLKNSSLSRTVDDNSPVMLGKDEEAQERDRHRDHLERTILNLKKKLVKDAETHRSDVLRLEQEQVALIRELNELRREERYLVQEKDAHENRISESRANIMKIKRTQIKEN